MATRKPSKPATRATVQATQPEPEAAKPAAVVMEAAPPAPMEAAPSLVVPAGYQARSIVWPAHFWRIFDRQAARAGLTIDKWLERYLQHIARE